MIEGRHVVTVFGSSGPAEGSEEYGRAFTLGKGLAEAGFTICNGGYGGTMEASARGARGGGGTTIGVVFSQKPYPNPWIEKVIVAETLLERLDILVSTGDAYVVLKGGTGTLLELAAIWELMNKGLMPEKPAIVLSWDPLVEALRSVLGSEIGKGGALIASVGSVDACVRYLHQNLGSET
jgi:hypothetical protein